MGRNSPDLHERLRNPDEARKYIETFDWGYMPKPDWIVLGAEERVSLEIDKLSDSEVVRAALCILIDVDIPTSMRESKLQRWEQ